MKINPSVRTAAQQKQIHEQHKKQDQLKQQKRQLELDLINCKQAAKRFQTILNVIKQKPNQKYNHSFILTNGQNLIDLLTKMKTMADRWVEFKSSQLYLLYEISVCSIGNLNIETQLKLQEVNLNEADGKIALHQKMIAQMRYQIAEIQQRLNECKADCWPEKQDRVTEFITEILSQYPNDINEKDIELIKELDLGALNYVILCEISENKRWLDQKKSQVLSLRHQILELQQQVQGKKQLQQQLQTNRYLNLKNNYQLSQITTFNDHLQANLSAQISRQLNQKNEMLNKSYLQSTDKYLMAGQYIVEGFKDLLGEDKYREMRQKLFSIKTQATEKIEKLSYQVRYEPMEDQI